MPVEQSDQTVVVFPKEKGVPLEQELDYGRLAGRVLSRTWDAGETLSFTLETGLQGQARTDVPVLCAV